MKKILLATLAVIAITSISQAQFKIGIKAGGNLAEQRVTSSANGSYYSNNHIKSYHAGVIADMKIAENVYLQPQILYTRKGSTLLSTTDATSSRVRLNYIDVPVNLLYKLPLSFGKIFAGTGATFSYGFSGKQQINGQQQKIYHDVKTWKHEDLALNFTAGLELNNGLFASINSQKGLLDVYKTSNTSVKNKSLSVSVGYLTSLDTFKKHKK
ncbi:MAG: outer membrane beta-barrel protein [Chitinophagaceae bacterium]